MTQLCTTHEQRDQEVMSRISFLFNRLESFLAEVISFESRVFETTVCYTSSLSGKRKYFSESY